MSAYAHFEVTESEGVTVLDLADRHLLDLATINALFDEMVDFVETAQPKKLVLGFGRVVRLGTEMINAMLRVRKRVAPYGGELKICDMLPHVREIFKVMRLDGTVFEIYDTAADAVEKF